MKRLTRIFQALLGAGALIVTSLIALGRLAWRTVRGWMRKLPKWVSVSACAALALVLAGLVANSYYESEYGRFSALDWDLSENVTSRFFKDRKYRLYDKQNKEYTTPRLDWVIAPGHKDSLAVYAVSGKRGYLNIKSGEVVIDAGLNAYGKAWLFSEGLAAVMKDGRIGFINARNEVVIPFRFDYSAECCMTGFGYLFHGGYCAMTNGDGDLGLIDSSGNWVVEPVYDEVWSPCRNGGRVVVKDGKYGLLDAECRIARPVGYDYVELLSDGYVFTKDGRMWQEDFDGNVVCPFMFSEVLFLEYPIGWDDEREEVIYALSDYLRYRVGNHYGIMNRKTGKPLTAASYSDVTMLSESLFKVLNPESGEWLLLPVSR